MTGSRLAAPGIVALSAAALAATMMAGSANAAPPASPGSRGLVYAGLSKESAGPCGGGFRVDVPNTTKVLCSHGPDAAPAGVDVTTAADTAAAASSTTTSTTTAACIGDGVSGQRVQLIYAVASDQVDNYSTLLPTLTGIAGQMEGAVNDSAAQTGGERHIRFVSNPDCSVNIAHVVLSPTGDDTFGNTIDELQAKGYKLPTRKYMIWMDASLYCGISTVFTDDSAAATNTSNTSYGYARVDRGCWGRTDHLSELHELVHTLGGVQPTAPHGTANFHCTDEYDAMCYQDSSGLVMTYPCPSANEWFLDCDHEDYFSTNPPAGTYLATHWNVASSGFLASSLADLGTTTTTMVTVTDTFTGIISSKKPSVKLTVTAGAGAESSALTFWSSGRTKTTPTLSMSLASSGGTVLVSGSGPSVLTQSTTLAAGSYIVMVSGSGSMSFSLAVTHVKAA